MNSQTLIATGEWLHNFGMGAGNVRCRLVIDLEEGSLLGAQEWTGSKFEDVSDDQLEHLSTSVIDAADAHFSPELFGLTVTRIMPHWVTQKVRIEADRPRL